MQNNSEDTKDLELKEEEINRLIIVVNEAIQKINDTLEKSNFKKYEINNLNIENLFANPKEELLSKITEIFECYVILEIGEATLKSINEKKSKLKKIQKDNTVIKPIESTEQSSTLVELFVSNFNDKSLSGKLQVEIIERLQTKVDEKIEEYNTLMSDQDKMIAKTPYQTKVSINHQPFEKKIKELFGSMSAIKGAIIRYQAEVQAALDAKKSILETKQKIEELQREQAEFEAQLFRPKNRDGSSLKFYTLAKQNEIKDDDKNPVENDSLVNNSANEKNTSQLPSLDKNGVLSLGEDSEAMISGADLDFSRGNNVRSNQSSNITNNAGGQNPANDNNPVPAKSSRDIIVQLVRGFKHSDPSSYFSCNILNQLDSYGQDNSSNNNNNSTCKLSDNDNKKILEAMNEAIISISKRILRSKDDKNYLLSELKKNFSDNPTLENLHMFMIACRAHRSRSKIGFFMSKDTASYAAFKSALTNQTLIKDFETIMASQTTRNLKSP